MGMSTAATTTVTESQFHVLAVDDSPFDRMLIERMLKTSSFQVESGSKALEFLGMYGNDQNNLTCPSVSPSNRQEVRLVITDYCMPEMTGYDLLKKIKESSYLKDIPVVIISSENVPSRISRCLEEGAEEFLLKPMKLSDVNKLRQLMQTRLKDQKQEIQEKQELQEVDLQTVDSQLQQLQQERLPQLQQKVESKVQQLQEEQLPQLQQNVESKLQHLQQEQLPPQQQQPAIPVNNKRKTMEDGLPQERARPKYEYDGLAAVV